MAAPLFRESEGIRKLPNCGIPSMLIRKEKHVSSSGRRPDLGGIAWETLTSRLKPRSESKQRLHRFTFPTMSWGSHWIFRCVSPVAGSGVSGAGFTITESRGDSPSGNRNFSSLEKPHPGSALLGGSSENKMEEGEQVENSSADAPATLAAAPRPWNLRTRRASCFAPPENGRNGNPSFSPTKRLFFLSLSRQEIEEDFYAFGGMKPPRRPQKRAKIVQRQLDALFLGFWLEDVTLDSYKVNL